MAKRVVITIDGLAGSGKSALARALAERLSFAYFSSGVLYRLVGFLANRGGIDPMNGPALGAEIDRHKIMVIEGPAGEAIGVLDGRKLLEELRAPTISEAASKVATHKEVRERLVAIQRGAFPGRGMVAEGRDMGTVIFPDAELKIFVSASPEVRAERRYRQLYGMDYSGSKSEGERKKELEIEILERDARDSSRTLSPTLAAPDAVIVDNSAKTLTEVLERMYTLAANRGLVSPSN